MTYDLTIIGKLGEKATNLAGKKKKMIISKEEAKYKHKICFQGPFHMEFQKAEERKGKKKRPQLILVFQGRKET